MANQWSERIRCSMCLQEFDSDKPMDHTGNAQYPITPPDTAAHTEQEWETWRIAQGIPDGQPYSRREFVDRPPIEPGPPPE